MNEQYRITTVVLMALAAAGCATGARAPATEPVGIAAVSGPCLATEPDADADGVSDGCEQALASAFAPLLRMHETRCTLPSNQHGRRIPGGYMHAAQPVDGTVRLVYMPAYYRDCGWSGWQCLFVDCSGHAGDSELIVVDVRRLPSGNWATDGVFLSAHCLGRTERDCRWYRGTDLDRFAWVDDIEHGAPVVWVSDARNANYPSATACDRGHLGLERCDRPGIPYRFPVTRDHNIGSRAAPIVEAGARPGCVSGSFVEPLDLLVVSPTAVECFWDATAPFRGWQGGGRGETAYGVYLAQLGL
jgi:hypothetical protein